jgi:hypothetical protein
VICYWIPDCRFRTQNARVYTVLKDYRGIGFTDVIEVIENIKVRPINPYISLL